MVMGVKLRELGAMINTMHVTPSPDRGRGSEPETRSGAKPRDGGM